MQLLLAGDTSKTTIPNVYNEISGIVTAINTSDFNFYHNTIEQYVVGDTIGFKNMFVIDLTAAYGAGNEPTKAKIEEVLNAFPSRWFNGSVEVTPPMNIDELIEEVNTKVSKEEFNEAISESKSNKTILKVSDYPNLRVALETATANASKEKPYEVQIGEGEVNLLSLYTRAEIENTGFQGVVISNYVTLVGTGKKDKTILRMEIPNTWLNATILRVAPIAYMGDGGMENLTVIGRNCRYTVHDDYGYPDTKKYIKNCTFIKLAGLGNSQAWGEGSFSGMEFYFEDCEFITEYGHAPYSTHNNIDFVKPSYHSFKNCKFINNGGYFGIRFITLRSGVMDKVDMEGCYIDGLIKCEELEAGNGCLFDINMHSCSEVPILIDATNGSQPVYTVIEETKKVFNAETTSITKGTPVMFNNDGSVILRLGSNPVSLILGIALQDIPASGKGVIKTGGYLPVTDTGLTLTKGDKVGVVAGALAKVTTGDYIGAVTRNGFIKLKF